MRHCGLWEGSLADAANPRASPRGSPGEPGEMQLVFVAEFLETEFREGQRESSSAPEPPGPSSPELQLVLDPEDL